MSQLNKKALELVKQNQDLILKGWLDELDNNPSIPRHNIGQKNNLETYSKGFLNDLIKTFQTEDIPSFNKESLSPIISLWHKLLQNQMSQGFSTKDTAMLIYTLKTSLVKINQSQKGVLIEEEELEKIEQLLDLLGILTFEIYSVEKEKLISRKTNQIQYLQTNKNDSTNVIGSSPSMHAVFKAIGLVLENDITVLIEGESGTGKDLIANIIHNNSKRKHNPLVTLNCGAIPKELIESELFGHEKGSFTGADERKLGKFELADGGTLFLDEIGELSVDLQVKLLRALQNKEIERVGGTQKIHINTRIIAATNRNLKQLVDEGKFRLDLYYRLNVFPIEMPALRDRKEDILPLAQYFLEKYAKEFNMTLPQLSQDAEKYLLNLPWEGNIRELENLMQRSLILSQGQIITSTLLESKPGHYDPQLLLDSPTENSEETKVFQANKIETLETIEKQAIEHALTIKKRNMMQVAKALGISRTTLYKKIEKYGLN